MLLAAIATGGATWRLRRAALGGLGVNGWGLAPIDATPRLGDYARRMDASARRVRSERDRRRLPERGPWARWTRRLAGLLATAVFLGVGFASAQMILPDTGKDGSAAVEAAPAATPTKASKTKKSDKKTKAGKPKGLTKAQKAARAAAVKQVRSQGFTTLSAADYNPKATLRVLIGRPVGDAGGGYQAFFFAKDAYLGKDALS